MSNVLLCNVVIVDYNGYTSTSS